MSSISPLELLHPEGRVERVAVLGHGCPPAMVPADATRAGSDVGLALIAPTPAEARERQWLERATERASRALADDGIAYALLAGRMRGRAVSLLRRQGMVVAPPLAHLAIDGAVRYLVPLSPGPWRHTLGRVVAARPLHRRAVRMVRSLPSGESLLTRALPTVGIAAQRRAARPLAAWIGHLGDETREPESVVVGTSWRGPSGPVVLHCFDPDGSHPWGIAKVGAASSGEGDALSGLGPAAGAAGVRVPRPLASGRLGRRSVLVESPIVGRPVACVLMRSPSRFRSLAGTLGAWLERWNLATAVTQPLSEERLAADILGPAGDLAPLIREGRSYASWLATRCAALAGNEIPVVAAHNDLTMWNVVIGDDGAIGVLDWAEASGAQLPLGDLFYALADASAACDRYASRLRAVQGCFTSAGSPTRRVDDLQRRAVRALDLAPEAVELCFHACWLRHARNEQGDPGADDGSFLEIVRWLARRVEAESR